MAYNQNAEITKEVKKNFGLSEITGYPQKVSEAILPVVDVKTKKLFSASTASLADAASVNVYTASSTKDTYIYGAQLYFIKDTNNLASSINLLIPDEDGQNQAILRVACKSATAQEGETHIMLPYPIKLRRGGVVTCTATDGTATILVRSCLYLYEEDASGA